MKPSVLLPAAVVAFVAFPAVASAQVQPWLADRQYTEGIGYRVGDFELHPGAAVEVGYDSNYTHSDVDPVGTMRLRLTPSFSFETLGSQRRGGDAGAPPPSVEFRGRVAATGDIFFGVSGDQKSQASSLSNIGIVSDLALQILPGHTWSGALTASYNRALTPTESVPQGAFSSTNTFDRDIPTLGGELVFTPGAGLLEFRLGYLFTGTFFEDGTNFQQLDNVNNQIQLRGRWRFLPRTALVYDGRFGFINYTSTGCAPECGAVHPNAHPVRSQLGVNGLVTSSFSVLAMGGWGASFYGTSADGKYHDFDSFIGQAELKWFLSPSPTLEPGNATLSLSSISVGFLRDFSDAFIGTYFERDRGYLNLSYMYAGKFLVVLEGGGAAIVYPEIPGATATAMPLAPTGFTDAHIDATLFGEWRFKDSFGINATLRYNQEVSSENLNVQTQGMTQSATLAYKEFEAYLGFRWLM